MRNAENFFILVVYNERFTFDIFSMIAILKRKKVRNGPRLEGKINNSDTIWSMKAEKDSISSSSSISSLEDTNFSVERLRPHENVWISKCGPNHVLM